MAALEKNDFAGFQDAEVAKRAGKPMADVPVAPKVETASAPVATEPPAQTPEAKAEATRQLSKRQQQTNEAARLAVERATADLQAEIARLKTQIPQVPQVHPAKQYAAMPDAPKVADFDTLEEHAAAMALFVQQQTAQETRQQQEHEAHRVRFEQRSAAYGERLQQAAAADPEFLSKIPPALVTARPVSVLRPGETVTFANVAAEVGFRSDAPDRFYQHLHSNPDAAFAIANLHPSEWESALTRLDGRLAASASVPAAPAAPAPAMSVVPSPISAAPSPPPTITRAATMVDPKQAALEKGNFAAFQEIERSERAARRASA